MIWITLQDRRVIAAPLDWYPWLEQATPEEQSEVDIGPFSILWPALEDGIDIEALLTGDILEAKGAQVDVNSATFR